MIQAAINAIGNVLAKSFFFAHNFFAMSFMSITRNSLFVFSSIVLYFNRLAMVANMVPSEAALVPILIHSARPMVRPLRLVGTTI